jgi:hypothetical protein
MPSALRILVLLVCTAHAATAQVSVAGARNLDFGVVATGMTTTVLPTDPAKSGQWTITATVGRKIAIRLTLPNRLNGPSGATMTVNFMNGDTFVQEVSTGSLPDYFSPSANKNFTFTGGTQAIVRLGGRVSPVTNQRSGAYSNSALLTVTVLN